MAIEAPLIAVFALGMWWNYTAATGQALADNEALIREAVAAEAGRFDAVFRELAAIADASAASITERPGITAEEARGMARSIVSGRPLAYGSCVAFEPGASPIGGQRFAPYAFRSGDAIKEVELPGVYDYTDGSWEWYGAPRASGRPVWTEPYFDEGAGNILMCTYASPFYGEGNTFRGVVTVDIPLSQLQALGTTTPVADGRGFIITTSKGTLVSCPDPTSIMQNVFDDLRIARDSPARAAVERMLAGETAVGLIEGFPQPGRHFVASAPIPSPNWRLGGSIPERVVMAPVNAALRDMALSRGAVILFTLVGILAMTYWLTRPVRRLHGAVQRVASGDLDARVEGVRARDELGDLARAFNAMSARLRAQIDALASEMSARESVESELRLARQIQSTLLPRAFPANERFAIDGLNAPARYVAGDFYDSVLEPTDGTALFTIADVSGKGVPAAMVMAVTRTIFRNLAVRGVGPARVVAAANTTLYGDDPNGMFVTLILARYDPASGALTYCNAGHPRPALVRADGAVELVGDITGTIVGAIPEADYADATITLAPGERLIFYTDGVTEARGPTGGFYGEQGLLALLGRIGREPFDRLCGLIRSELESFEQGKRADDITVLVLERRV
ncbi:MAG TPA: hypothetical protein DEB06_04680 [Phycisphaerales bacterium]|nr:hypothetical protein [Phycisphaerales bacterium]